MGRSGEKNLKGNKGAKMRAVSPNKVNLGASSASLWSLGVFQKDFAPFPLLILQHRSQRCKHCHWLCDLVTLLALVAKMATRWRHLHGATCIICKFGHQMALLALVANMATKWHYLHYLRIWPPDGTTCIGCKFGHQITRLAIVTKLATMMEPHCLQIWPP